MPLTPAEIHNVELGKASIGKRGYDAEQVDALLDEVSGEMIRLLEENDALQRRLDPADGPVRGPAAPDRNVEIELSAVIAELNRARRACDHAQLTARRVERQLVEARQSAVAGAAAGDSPDRVLAVAQRTANDHLRRAEEESHALVAAAREDSESMVREAQRMGNDVEQGAHRHRTEAAAQLATRRANLLTEIDALTKFAENYRTALENRVVRHQRLLDGAPEPAADRDLS